MSGRKVCGSCLCAEVQDNRKKQTQKLVEELRADKQTSIFGSFIAPTVIAYTILIYIMYMCSKLHNFLMFLFERSLYMHSPISRENSKIHIYAQDK